jgi:hypothetical protein
VSALAWRSAGVLAGAYCGKPKRFITHAVLTRNGSAIHVACTKVEPENLAQDYDQRPVNCPRCLRVVGKTEVVS